MVGVCLTVIGLIRVVITLRKADTFADDLLAFDAILFLLACCSSYWALRTRSAQRMYRLERFADVVVPSLRSSSWWPTAPLSSTRSLSRNRAVVRQAANCALLETRTARIPLALAPCKIDTANGPHARMKADRGAGE